MEHEQAGGERDGERPGRGANDDEQARRQDQARPSEPQAVRGRRQRLAQQSPDEQSGHECIRKIDAPKRRHLHECMKRLGEWGNAQDGKEGKPLRDQPGGNQHRRHRPTRRRQPPAQVGRQVPGDRDAEPRAGDRANGVGENVEQGAVTSRNPCLDRLERKGQGGAERRERNPSTCCPRSLPPPENAEYAKRQVEAEVDDDIEVVAFPDKRPQTLQNRRVSVERDERPRIQREVGDDEDAEEEELLHVREIVGRSVSTRTCAHLPTTEAAGA